MNYTLNLCINKKYTKMILIQSTCKKAICRSHPVSCFGESMLPFGARAGNLYIGRTPCGGRPVINISPGILQGSARARKGSRPTPSDTVRFPLYILTKIGKRNRAVPGRAPYVTRRVFHGLFTCYRFG